MKGSYVGRIGFIRGYAGLGFKVRLVASKHKDMEEVLLLSKELQKLDRSGKVRHEW